MKEDIHTSNARRKHSSIVFFGRFVLHKWIQCGFHYYNRFVLSINILHPAGCFLQVDSFIPFEVFDLHLQKYLGPSWNFGWIFLHISIFKIWKELNLGKGVLKPKNHFTFCPYFHKFIRVKTSKSNFFLFCSK